MISKIKSLEEQARLLEPTVMQRRIASKNVMAYTDSFLDNIYQIKAFVKSKDKGRALLEMPIGEEPMQIDHLLNIVYEQIDTPGLNPASGGHLGYIPGGGLYYSALADYMAAITNRYAGVFFASPGAVRLEHSLINWMAQLAGYPATAGGNLASGGSIANLTAIVAARDAHDLKAADFHKVVIYTSEHVHHCIDKAIRIAGLVETVRRNIPLDKHFRIISSELDKSIEQDKQQGLIPWLVIASAGTTDVGAVDPLNEIADIAERNKLWFHVDAAYGGFFLLTEYGRSIMKGIERSDSLVMDPHKGLFLPYGLGAVLLRDKQKLYKSQYYDANYMQDALNAHEELSPAELSPELTKHFRGLRMWLPLKMHGLGPFRAALEEKLLLARYFYEEIQKTAGFEVGEEPQLSVVTFRYVPESGDADKFNERLVAAVQEDGRIFVSSTMINGQYTIRLAVLSFRTHLDTIQLTMEILKNKVKELL